MEGILPIIILIVIANVFRNIKKAQKTAPRKTSSGEAQSPAREFKDAVFGQLSGIFGADGQTPPAGSNAVPAPNLDWARNGEAAAAANPITGNSTIPAQTGFPSMGTTLGSTVTLTPREEIGSRLENATLSEGFSREDDEGCLGGSIEHAAETEGKPRAPIFANASAQAETPRAKALFTAAQMRRAVIASEILSAPVSLRGKSNGRLNRL